MTLLLQLMTCPIMSFFPVTFWVEVSKRTVSFLNLECSREVFARSRSGFNPPNDFSAFENLFNKYWWKIFGLNEKYHFRLKEDFFAKTFSNWRLFQKKWTFWTQFWTTLINEAFVNWTLPSMFFERENFLIKYSDLVSCIKNSIAQRCQVAHINDYANDTSMSKNLGFSIETDAW